MSALLNRRHRAPRVLRYVLGRSCLADCASAVVKALRDGTQDVVVQVSGFDYFDENELMALADIATWSPRIRVVGLDAYAELLLPTTTRESVDVRSRGERAVKNLTAVTVVTAMVDARPLDDHEWEHALTLAVRGARAIVTADLRHLDRFSPAQLLSLAEASAELARDLRTLVIVNATTATAEQVRNAGLSGELRMSVADFS